MDYSNWKNNTQRLQKNWKPLLSNYALCDHPDPVRHARPFFSVSEIFWTLAHVNHNGRLRGRSLRSDFWRRHDHIGTTSKYWVHSRGRGLIKIVSGKKRKWGSKRWLVLSQTRRRTMIRGMCFFVNANLCYWHSLRRECNPWLSRSTTILSPPECCTVTKTCTNDEDDVDSIVNTTRRNKMVG